MKRKIWKRLSGLLLSAAILAGSMPAALAAESGKSEFTWKQVDNSAVTARLERRSVPEQEAEGPLYADNETVRVSIELENAPTLEKFDLDQDGGCAASFAVKTYRSLLEIWQKLTIDAISKQVLQGKDLDVVWNLTLAANIISANVEYGEIDAIQKVAGVKSVFIEKQYAPDTVSIGGSDSGLQISTNMTGTQSGAWANGYQGQGMRIAIIDTGLDTDHQSFDAEAFTYALEEDAADDGKAVTDYDLLDQAEISGVLPQLNAFKNGGVTAANLYCTAKVPYGYCYVDKGLDITHDHDQQGGHGSHVAGISTANRYLKTDSGFVSAMEKVRMTGQAPDAQVLVMKVFGKNGGAFDSDFMAAIEDAIWLGCDTINLSLVSPYPGFAREPGYTYQDIMDALVSKNVIVTASAGNNGAWPDASTTGGALYSGDVNFATGGCPGSFTNSLCVASVDSDGAAVNSQTPPQYTMSSFSSWGVPGDLSLKPEVTAPGGNVWSINGEVPDKDQYILGSGTSMAAPQAAGIGALIKQFIEKNGYSQAGMTDRALAQSLMMSTATPLKDENGQYYPVLQQGAGLLNAAAATSADSYITVDGQEDGKVKLELGDDPDKTGVYQIQFDIHNLDGIDREYELSGQLFTQAVQEDAESGSPMLTKDTETLESTVSWTVEGAVPLPDKSVRGCDFNGDGTVDQADAQLLLDHVIQGEALVKNADKADIDGDANIDTHDVHEFLKKLSVMSTVVPANGNITVTASITVDADAADAQMADCPNGFYVEGYIKAAGKAVSDGREGTVHSIPLLGYYGNWSDPSMFEKGTAVEYAFNNGNGLPAPYMKNPWVNYVELSRADGSAILFGGNPYNVEDDAYLPERSALNNTADDILAAWTVTPIRNAAASRLMVKNAEDSGQVYLDTGDLGPAVSAFYSPKSKYWQSTRQTLSLGWTGTDANGAPLPEGTTAELSVTLAPEYYADGEDVAWDKLGRGAVLTQQVTIDNTAPQIVSVGELNRSEKTVEVTALDNQYVAAIVLTDPTGRRVLSAKCPNQKEKNVNATVTLDLSQVVGKNFLLQIMDYACNTYTCEVSFSGLVSDITDPSYVFFDQETGNWWGLQNGPLQKSGVLGNSAYTVRAAEMVNGCLFALDGPDEGNTAFSSTLYAMPVGNVADFKKVAAVAYTDPDGKEYAGYPLDMAYSKKDRKLYCLIRADEAKGRPSYLYSLDPLTGAAELKGVPLDSKGTPLKLATLAIDDDNNFYSLSDSAMGTAFYRFKLSDLSTSTVTKAVPEGTPMDKSLTCVQGYASTDWDSGSKKLVYALTHCGTFTKRPDAPTTLYELDPADPGAAPKVIHTCGEKEMYLLAGLAVKDSDDGLDLSTAHQAVNVTLSETEVETAKGGRFQLEATVAPWTLDNREVGWESSDTSVATVAADGTVTAVGTGTARITAFSKATPSQKAECLVNVFAIRANLKALTGNKEGSFWWSKFDTNSLPNYDKLKETGLRYGAATMAESGKLYAATLEGQKSILYAVDPDTLESTEVGPIILDGKSMYVSDLASFPTFSRYKGTDYLIGICGGFVGLVINGETGNVESTFELNDGAIISPVAIALLGSLDSLGIDLYAYIGSDGGVYKGLMIPLEDGVLAPISQTAILHTGVRTNGYTKYNSLAFAKTEDDRSYLIWSVYDGDDSDGAATDLYAIDLIAMQAYPLGSFPKGVQPVVGLIPEKVPPVEEVGPNIFATLQEGFDGPQALASMEDFDPELSEELLSAWVEKAGGHKPVGSLCSIEVKDEEGNQSVQAVAIDETAQTVTVPITAAQSTNGQFTLAYDASALTFQSVSCGGSAFHSENTAAAGEVTVGYADLDEINGRLAEVVFSYEPAEEEQIAAVSLKITEDGVNYNTTPADGSSIEVTLPAKPVQPSPSGQEPEPGPEPDMPEFLDVPESSWYHDDISRVAKTGLMYGTGARLFSPDARLTRGMLAVILHRLEGEPEAAAGERFADVPSGRWFSEGVNWAASKGIVAGYGNGRYGPNDPITREQLAVIMARYAKVKAYDMTTGAGALDGYQDSAKVSGWARSGLAWACTKGLIYGRSGGTLDPQGKASRAETAAILIRFMDLAGKQE